MNRSRLPTIDLTRGYALGRLGMRNVQYCDMPKLLGSLIGGEPCAVDVTARTRMLKLHKYQLAALDLSGLLAAPNLENITSGQSPIAVNSLLPLAACPGLNSLSISLPSDTDLSPLSGCKALRYLSLGLHGDAPCRLAELAMLPNLESLSIVQRGQPPPLDLSPLRGNNLSSVNLSGLTNTQLELEWVSSAFTSLEISNGAQLTRLDLGPLARSRLEFLRLITCPNIERLDLTPLADLPLKRIAISSVGVAGLSLAPLASCAGLESLQVVGHSARTLDVTPLAKLSKLDHLDLDGKNPPWLSEPQAKLLASPALQAWHKAGRLTVE